MNTDTLTGMTVLSLAGGTRLGKIEGVAIDPQSLQVVALRIAANGQRALVPWESLQGIGKDAVTVPDEHGARWSLPAGGANSLPDIGDLRNLRVVDEAGKVVGKVRDLDFDAGTGKIISLITHEGGILGIGGTTSTIPAGAVVSLGPEVITVRAAATEPAARAQ